MVILVVVECSIKWWIARVFKTMRTLTS